MVHQSKTHPQGLATPWEANMVLDDGGDLTRYCTTNLPAILDQTWARP